MSEKYLVLGASGNLGIRVTAHLVGKGKCVRGLVRKPDTAGAITQLGAEVGLLDLEDPRTLAPHLHGVTHVINTSYISYAPNIIRAIQGRKEFVTGLRHLVFIGSTGVYTRLKSESAETKRIGERAVKESGLPFTILRPTMIYGHAKDKNIARLLKLFRKTPIFPVFGDGLAKIQPVYIGDVVKAVSNVMESPQLCGKTYDVGGPNCMTYLRLLETAAIALGKRIYFLRIPIWFALPIIKMLSALRVSPVSVEQVLRLTENKAVDNSLAMIDFRYDPITFEQGLRLELRDLEEQTGAVGVN